jgi:predicted PhzF superfamily epimerase YddE/YHI9
MPKSYRIYQVDAFTRTRFSGNPAGVVPDAAGLDEAQMQAIARELNNSETAFILPSGGPDHDVHVRFFTPTTEVQMRRAGLSGWIRQGEAIGRPGRVRVEVAVDPASLLPTAVRIGGDAVVAYRGEIPA